MFAIYSRSVIYADISYPVKYDLDIDKMKKEAKSLIGTYDFKGFMDFDPEEGMGDSTENNQNYEYATAKPVMGGIDLTCGK